MKEELKKLLDERSLPEILEVLEEITKDKQQQHSEEYGHRCESCRRETAALNAALRILDPSYT